MLWIYETKLEKKQDKEYIGVFSSAAVAHSVFRAVRFPLCFALHKLEVLSVP